MQVDRHNFKQVVTLLEPLLERSHAISIDLEFTGLRFDNNQKERPEDLIFQRYDKMRQVASKYNIIQFGLSCFVEQENCVKAYPFNFYLFPRGYKTINPVITLQSSTVQFNSKNGMDWNKWIRDGITYIQIDKLVDSIAVPERATFDELEKKLTVQQRNELNSAMIWLQQFFISKTETSEFQTSSTFMRLVIDKYIEKKYSSIYLQPSISDSPLKQKLLLLVRRVDPESRTVIENDIKLNIVGFTKIFEKIWKSELKIIGHNSFFDLLYIYHSLVNDLPFDYFRFKQEIREGFPNFYDTKFMAQRPEFQKIFTFGTSLQELYKQIKSNPTFFNPVAVVLDEKFLKYDPNNQKSEELLHQAGYDAYLTGWIYYHLKDKIENVQTTCKNKLKLVRSMYDIDLDQFEDIYSEANLIFVCTIKRPNIYVHNLFEFKKRKIQENLELIKQTFGNKNKYNPEDVKYRESRVDYIFIELRNADKMKKFIEDLCILKRKDLEIGSIRNYLREKRGLMTKTQ